MGFVRFVQNGSGRFSRVEGVCRGRCPRTPEGIWAKKKQGRCGRGDRGVGGRPGFFVGQAPAIISDWRTMTSACLIEAMSTRRPL